MPATRASDCSRSATAPGSSTRTSSRSRSTSWSSSPRSSTTSTQRSTRPRSRSLRRRADEPEPEVEPRAGDHDRRAAALPEGHRQGSAAHGGAGGRAREAHRARRARGEAGDGGGEPPPRRLDREALSQPGAPVPRPDPGGDDRARPRGGEVRLPQGLQVLDVRDLVDPPGGRAGDRGQGPDDPHARARRREAQPDHALGAEAPCASSVASR